MRKKKTNLLRSVLLPTARSPGLPMLGPSRSLPQPEVRIEAVVARRPRRGDASAVYPWREASSTSAFVALSRGTRLGDVAAVASALCEANHVEPRGDAEQTFAALLDVDGWTLPGGLAFLLDGARAVVPGCCAGLEGWRSWQSLLESGTQPWGGHDPFASAVLLGREVHVFADASMQPKVILDAGSYEGLLLDVERDLLNFVRLFEGFVLETAPALARPVAQRFGRDLRITRTDVEG